MNFKTLFLLTLATLSSLAAETSGILQRVVDGDTLYFQSSQGAIKCRIAYIDTPESRSNAKAMKDIATCPTMTAKEMVRLGKEASAFTQSILTIGERYAITITGSDHHGRSTCLVQTSKGSLGEILIQEGYAIPFWRYMDNPADKILYTWRLAQAIWNKKGLWSVSAGGMLCLML